MCCRPKHEQPRRLRLIGRVVLRRAPVGGRIVKQMLCRPAVRRVMSSVFDRLFSSPPYGARGDSFEPPSIQPPGGGLFLAVVCPGYASVGYGLYLTSTADHERRSELTMVKHGV